MDCLLHIWRPFFCIAQLYIRLHNSVKRLIILHSSYQPKVVGKKSLLRTLQTLGSVPVWKSDDHQQESDSETETAPTHSKKKKKKRTKKRKHAVTSEELEENVDLDHCVEKEKTVTKKKKKTENKLGE